MDTDDKEVLTSLMEPADAMTTLYDHTIIKHITYCTGFTGVKSLYRPCGQNYIYWYDIKSS